MSQWNRERTRALLRYARKQCGPWDWDEHDTPEWRDGDIPDDDDVDLVTQAPAMLEWMQKMVFLMEAHCLIAGGNPEDNEQYCAAKAIIRKATGDDN